MKSLILAVTLMLSASAFSADFNGYIVKLKKGSQAFSNTHSLVYGEVRPLNFSFGHFVKINPAQSLTSINIDKLRNHPDVEYVEPNYIYNVNPIPVEEIESVVSDGMYKKQWGLKNTGKNSGGWFTRGKAGEDVNAEKAWEITKGDNEIVIAVIDTGIDYNHKDLKNNMWVNEAEKNGTVGVDDDGNGYVDDIYGYDFVNKDGDPMDGNKHGTHCAGVIGASHNSSGIAGVMANVKLMGIKFLSDTGSGETIDAISSIEYAIRNGAHIMSNSWGGGEKSEALKEAIQAASDAGILFVAAAGNSSSDNDSKNSFPANYNVENIITVGSISGTGKKSGFSNYGRTSVHVLAPGANILSTVPNDRYKKLSGTSMAAPHVSGVLGLLLSSEKGIDFREAKERLMKTSVNNKLIKRYSIAGRVDAYRMLKDIRN